MSLVSSYSIYLQRLKFSYVFAFLHLTGRKVGFYGKTPGVVSGMSYFSRALKKRPFVSLLRRDCLEYDHR